MGFVKLPEDLCEFICSFLEVIDCCRCQMVGEARLYHAANPSNLPIMLVGGPLFDNTTLLHIFNGVSRNLAAERPEGSTNLAPIKNVAVTSFGLVGCHPGLTLGAINCGLLIRRGALMHLRLSNCSTLFFPIFADDESSELENVVDDGWSILSAHCAALESLDLSFSGEPVGKAGESLRANSELASQFAAAVSKLVGASPLLKQLWLRGCPALQTGGGLLDVLDACGANVEVLDLSRLPDLAARTTPGAPLLGPYWPPHNSVVKAALLDTTNPSEGASKWARTLRCLSIRGACLDESNIEGLCQLHALEKLDLAAVDGVTDDSLESLLAEEREVLVGPRGSLGKRLRALSIAGCNDVTVRGVKMLAAAVNGDVRPEVEIPNRSFEGVSSGERSLGEQLTKAHLNDDSRSSSEGGQLTSLSLHGCVGVNDSAVKSLQRLGALEELNISATHITAKGLRALFAARTNGAVEKGCLLPCTASSEPATSGAPKDRGLVLPVLRAVNARCLPGKAKDLAAAVGSLKVGVALRSATSSNLSRSNSGKWRVFGGEAPAATTDHKTTRVRDITASAAASAGGGGGSGGANSEEAAVPASATETKLNVSVVPLDWSKVPRAVGATALAAWVGMRGLPGDVAATVMETLHPLARPQFVSSLLDPSQYPHGNSGQQQRHTHAFSAPPTLVVDEEGLVVGAVGHPLASPPRRWEERGHATAPIVPLPF